MDAASSRRKSQGLSGKTTVGGGVVPVVPVLASSSISPAGGMKNSISRPESFLPMRNDSVHHHYNNALESSSTTGTASASATVLQSSLTNPFELSKDRLIQLLSSVEDEYDKVIKENARLRAQIVQMSQSVPHNSINESVPYQPSYKLAGLNSKYTMQLVPGNNVANNNDETHSPPQTSSADNSFHKLKNMLKEEQLQKFKTSSRRKIASATSRLRNVPSADAQIVRSYVRHNDGIWDVATPKSASCPYALFGTASADQTACIWNAKTGHCLSQYQGHDGSVNSIRFQPVRISAGDHLLLLTASGDQTAHVWKVNPAQLADLSRESDEERPGDMDATTYPTKPSKLLVNYPLMVLRSHTNAVSCAEWITGTNQVITASWDRTAIVFDVETGDNLNTFAGHDDELTFVAVCRSHKLFATCSKDTTFRLWDLREPNLQSVSVFQGHSEAVNCAVFTPGGESIISGGDDKVLRVWDLRNMRTPKSSVRMEDGINRIAISDSLIVSVPLDNRNVGMYSLNTGKLSRLPRAKRQGHQRMVTASAWWEDLPSTSSNCDINLLTCGFDRQVLGWKTGVL